MSWGHILSFLSSPPPFLRIFTSLGLCSRAWSDGEGGDKWFLFLCSLPCKSFALQVLSGSLCSQMADARTTTGFVVLTNRFPASQWPKKSLIPSPGPAFPPSSFVPPSSQLILLLSAPHLPSFPPYSDPEGKNPTILFFFSISRGVFFGAVDAVKALLVLV